MGGGVRGESEIREEKKKELTQRAQSRAEFAEKKTRREENPKRTVLSQLEASKSGYGTSERKAKRRGKRGKEGEDGRVFGLVTPVRGYYGARGRETGKIRRNGLAVERAKSVHARE